MVLRRSSQTTFDRRLYAAIDEKVRLHHRSDDQKEGTVVALLLFHASRSQTVKTGEPIQGEMSSDHRTTWHIPKRELLRVGVHYINATDKIEQIVGEEAGRFWQPESTTSITVKLFGDFVIMDCLRIDPPNETTLHHPKTS